VADVAWKAMEFTQHHHLHENHQHEPGNDTKNKPVDEKLESLRSENKRLRNLLEQNLKLLQNLAESPCLLHECPTHVCSFPSMRESGAIYLASIASIIYKKKFFFFLKFNNFIMESVLNFMGLCCFSKTCSCTAI
jgi:hypothetical protein